MVGYITIRYDVDADEMIGYVLVQVLLFIGHAEDDRHAHTYALHTDNDSRFTMLVTRYP